jgi:hypothetical protein
MDRTPSALAYAKNSRKEITTHDHHQHPNRGGPMTVQADMWLTKQVAPPPHDWVALFDTNEGLEVRDVVAVLVQTTEMVEGRSSRCALAVATFDGFLIPVRDQDEFVGAMARADYQAAVGRRTGDGS